MEEIIRIKYGILADEIKEIESGFLIRSGFKLYKIVETRKSVEEIKEIVNVLEMHKIIYDKVIIQSDNELIVEYKEKKYLLLEVKQNKTRDIMIEMLDKSIDIVEKWKANIDKLEMLLRNDREFLLGNREIVEYYRYNAETALKIGYEAKKYGYVECYLQKIDINKEISVENLVFESRMRRIAIDFKEYIKNIELNNKVIDKLENDFKLNVKSKKEELLLCAYLFYPEFLFKNDREEWFEGEMVNKIEVILNNVIMKIKNVEIKSLH